MGRVGQSWDNKFCSKARHLFWNLAWAPHWRSHFPQPESFCEPQTGARPRRPGSHQRSRRHLLILWDGWPSSPGNRPTSAGNCQNLLMLSCCFNTDTAPLLRRTKVDCPQFLCLICSSGISLSFRSKIRVHYRLSLCCQQLPNCERGPYLQETRTSRDVRTKTGMCRV